MGGARLWLHVVLGHVACGSQPSFKASALDAWSNKLFHENGERWKNIWNAADLYCVCVCLYLFVCLFVCLFVGVFAYLFVNENPSFSVDFQFVILQLPDSVNSSAASRQTHLITHCMCSCVARLPVRLLVRTVHRCGSLSNTWRYGVSGSQPSTCYDSAFVVLPVARKKVNAHASFCMVLYTYV